MRADKHEKTGAYVTAMRQNDDVNFFWMSVTILQDSGVTTVTDWARFSP